MEKRLRNPYWKVDYEASRSLVRVVRTEVEFAKVADVVSSVGEVSAVLDSIGRKTFSLLGDLRQGPMRNDAAFEAAMNAERPRLLKDIRRIAILVKTPLGSLQLSRHQRQGSIAWTTFNDETAALEFLGMPKR